MAAISYHATKPRPCPPGATMTAVVVYHASCPDGFCAAWAAWKKLGDDAAYFPLHYDSKLPENKWFEGRDVYLVDFSWPLDVLERVAKIAKSVVVLDHHKSAAEALAGTRYAEHIRMDWSGAHLAWTYFHGQTTLPVEPFVPTIVRYIEDNDLWRHQLPDWEAIKLVIEQMDFKAEDAFKAWDDLATKMEASVSDGGFKEIVEQGRACVAYRRTLLERMTADPPFTIIDGYKVPCVNTCLWQSEVGDILDKRYPFAVVWRMLGGGTYGYSLRSDKNSDVDVSAIAKKFGGGGHKHAAGFTSNSPPMIVAK